jgi:Flp pilus assembly protein TadG
MHPLALKGGGPFDSRRRGFAPRRGTAVVEFALVAPLFLMIVIGVIEIGRATMVQELLTNASREGARVAGNDTTVLTSSVRTAVNNYLSGVGISDATTSVSPDPPSGASDGQSVTVTVTIPYSKVSWLASSWFLGGKTLTATSVMIRQPSP